MKLNDDFNIEKTDYAYIIFILVFSILTVLKMIDYHMSGGIFNHDKSLYLINALVFAGLDHNNIHFSQELFISPFISLLTSILFRFGLVNKLSIFIVTGFFGLFGNVGLYILLRNRFNYILSFTGAIIFGSLSIILLNVASGLLDFPSVVISIWILIFMIIAVNKNSKYYLIIFPLLIIGFFTRYTVGFILPVILFYYLINKDVVSLIDEFITNNELFKEKFFNYLKSDEFKYICFSFILGIILLILFCKLIINYGGSLSFINQSIGTFNGAKFNPNAFDSSEDKLYYVKNIVDVLFIHRRFDGTLTYLLISILMFGILLSVFNIFKNFSSFSTLKNSKTAFKTNNFEKILKLLIILLIVGIVLGFQGIDNHMVINIMILILMMLLFSILMKYNFNKEKFSFDFLMIIWFLIYFVFSAMYDIKVPRYAMPFIPPLISFVIYGLNNILGILKNNFDNSESLKYKFYNKPNISIDYSKFNVIPIILMIIFLISSFTFIIPLSIGSFGNDLVEVTTFIKEHDSNYHSKIIISEPHNYRTVKWYLNQNVDIAFSENPHELDLMKGDYMILQKNESLKNYKNIFHSGRFYLYSYVDK